MLRILKIAAEVFLSNDCRSNCEYWTAMNEQILRDAKAELERHMGTFIDGDKTTIALGGKGIIVGGCEACQKRIGTHSQYLRHLADDVLPGILDNAVAETRS